MRKRQEKRKRKRERKRQILKGPFPQFPRLLHWKSDELPRMWRHRPFGSTLPQKKRERRQRKRIKTKHFLGSRLKAVLLMIE
jgi:hypothetical protein